MLGAILGDYLGSIYEFSNYKSTEAILFAPECNFTDDTILTAATAWALMNGNDFESAYRNFCMEYPGRGYGDRFCSWAYSYKGPYNSYGNGSAMRVSPVAWVSDNYNEIMKLAKMSAEVTHNHPEGIKGAQAVAAAIYFARAKMNKSEIEILLNKNFGYDFNFSLDDIRESYQFNESCQGTVPQAIKAYLESDSFEWAIRLAISIGGDTDTIAAITGSIAEAEYCIPEEWKARCLSLLPSKIKTIYDDFTEKYKF